MTPTEIVKAVECCMFDTLDMCPKCPYHKVPGCDESLLQDLKKLIVPKMLTIDEVMQIGRRNWEIWDKADVQHLWLQQKEKPGKCTLIAPHYPAHMDDPIMYEDYDCRQLLPYTVGRISYDCIYIKYYGQNWVCWNLKPGKEDIEGVEWREN